jgi:hypothetical protein
MNTLEGLTSSFVIVLLILFDAAGYWKLDVGGYVLFSWILQVRCCQYFG